MCLDICRKGAFYPSGTVHTYNTFQGNVVKLKKCTSGHCLGEKLEVLADSLIRVPEKCGLVLTCKITPTSPVGRWTLEGVTLSCTLPPIRDNGM